MNSNNNRSLFDQIEAAMKNSYIHLENFERQEAGFREIKHPLVSSIEALQEAVEILARNAVPRSDR